MNYPKKNDQSIKFHYYLKKDYIHHKA